MLADLPNAVTWALAHPLEDKVLFYPAVSGESPVTPSQIFSGSTALLYVARLLNQCPSWTPTDTDIYQLAARENLVRQDKTTRTDHVQVVYRTVEELLLDFDLPCCRAAYDANQNIWVSAQCLLALTTGQYFLPAFLSQRSVFISLLRTTKRLEGHPNADDVEDFCYRRYISRIEKYEQRGYRATLIDTTEVPRWLSRNFFGSSMWSS